MFNWLKDDIKGVMALPRHRKAIIAGFVLFAALVQTAMATSDVRVVGPVTLKGSASFPITVVGGTVSTLNSSTDTVPAGGSFLGAAEDCSQAGTIIITVYTNVGDTTTNELTVSFSPDGVIWPNGDGYRVGQNLPRTFSIVPRAKYFKVSYSNGSGSPSTEFYLQTVLKTAGIKDSLQFGTSDLPTDQQSQPVVARLVAENEDSGAFVGLRTNIDDHLTVAVKEIDSAITLPVSGPLTDSELRATPVSVTATQGSAAAVSGAWPFRITDGTDSASITSDGALQVQERFLAIAKGEVTGHTLMLKFGRNTDVDTGAAEDVWEGGGLYTFDTTAQSLEIISSAAADDGSPGGTGARTITVRGLDANYAEQVETVTLNGTTAVALSGTWLRVHRCQVATAGSSEANEGTLTVRLAGAGASRLVVGPLNGQTLMAVYTIPAGKTGYVVQYYISGNASPTAPTMDVSLWTRSSGGVRNLKHQQALTAGQEMRYVFGSPFQITEKTDVWLRAQSSVNNSDVCGGFDIVLVAN